MTGSRITVEADVSGVNGAMDSVEQKAKKTSEAAQAAFKKVGASIPTKELERFNRELERLQKSGAKGSGKFSGAGNVEELVASIAANNASHSDQVREIRNALRSLGHSGRFSRPSFGGDEPSQQQGGGVYRAVQRFAPMFGGLGGVVGRAAGDGAASGGGIAGAGGFLKSLGIGAALYAGYKVAGAVGDSGNEATGYSDLRAKLGPLTTDFDKLRDSVRYATRGLGLTYDEALKMASGFAHTANSQAEDAKELHKEVTNAGGFGRGFGMAPEQAGDFFAQMRRFGVTGNADDSRKLALMIGDSVSKGGNTAKADEVLAAVSNFTAIAARQSLATPDAAGFASMLSSLTGLKLPGMDVSGAGSMLQRMNSALSGGGGVGEASQNFSLGMYQRAMPGFDALDMGIMGSAGAFGRVKDVFGENSVAYRAADEKTQERYRGYVGAAGNDRLLDIQLGGIKQQYRHDHRLMRNAGSRQLGISESEFSSLMMAHESDGGVSGLMDDLDRLNVPKDRLNMKSIGALAQLKTGDNETLVGQADKLRGLQGADALGGKELAELNESQKKGGEYLRDTVMKLTATHDTVKDEGQRTRENLADIKNAVSDFASKLLPLMNSAKEGISALVSVLAPFSDFAASIRARPENSARDKASTQASVKDFDEKIRFFDNEGGDKNKANEYRGFKRQLLKAQRDVAFGKHYDSYTDDFREWIKGAAEGAGVDAGDIPQKGTGKARKSSVDEVKQKIVEEAKRQGVPPEIALSLAQTESGFNADAQGPVIKSGMHKGDRAYGVYQYMGETARGAGINRYDTDENIRQGISDLKKHKARFGSWDKAIAAHHAGPGAVANGIPNTSDGNMTTREYTDKVLKGASESGNVPGAGVPGANGDKPQKVSMESRVILMDRDGNQLHDPIIQTSVSSPVPSGMAYA